VILGVVSGSKPSDDAVERLVRLADDDDVVLTGTVPAERKLAAILAERGVTVEQVPRRIDLFGKEEAGILEVQEVVNEAGMVIALGKGRRPDFAKELWARSLGHFAAPATDAWIAEAIAVSGDAVVAVHQGGRRVPVTEWEPVRGFAQWK
jgi:hypothetical protein